MTSRRSKVFFQRSQKSEIRRTWSRSLPAPATLLAALPRWNGGALECAKSRLHGWKGSRIYACPECSPRNLRSSPGAAEKTFTFPTSRSLSLLTATPRLKISSSRSATRCAKSSGKAGDLSCDGSGCYSVDRQELEVIRFASAGFTAGSSDGSAVLIPFLLGGDVISFTWRNTRSV